MSYAPVEPRPVHRPPAPPVAIRVAAPDDVAGIVSVAATRGEQPADLPERVVRWLADDARLVLVAVPEHGTHEQPHEQPDEQPDEARRDVVGWGMVARWAPDDAPHGHVVSALTVHPRWWRRGIGARLLGELQAWTWDRADELWSIVNVRNEASVDLHLRAGFVEVARAAAFGGVQFDGGEGLLLRASAPGRSAP